MCTGEILVDVIPVRAGAYRDGSLLELHFGGAPANVAVGVARLGGRSGFIGAVGSDPLGDLLLGFLEEEAVYTGWVRRKNARTSLAFVMLREDGERSFFFYRAPWTVTADSLLSHDDVDWDAVERAKVLHFSGVALSQAPLSDTVREMVRYASKHGVAVSYDPNFRLDLWQGSLELARSRLTEVMEHVSLLTLGLDELTPVFGHADYLEAARSLLADYPSLDFVAIRLGQRGAFVASRGEGEALVEAFKVRAVDTTGAGDAWTAAFIQFKLIEDRGLEEAVTLANAVAGLKCTRKGAVTGIPRRSELKEFLASRGVDAEL